MGPRCVNSRSRDRFNCHGTEAFVLPRAHGHVSPCCGCSERPPPMACSPARSSFLFPLSRPARCRLPDCGQTRPPQGISADQRPPHLQPLGPLGHQQAGNQTGSRHHLGLEGHAGVGVGDGAVAVQRDDHCCTQPWHPRWQAARRDPLVSLEFAHWRQGPAESHPAAHGHHAQLGDQCPAAGRNLVDHRGHRRPGSRHQRVAQAAGLARRVGDASRMTSNRP